MTTTTAAKPTKEQDKPLSAYGQISLYQTQAEYLQYLLSLVPTKGAFAHHKTRIFANLSPQFKEYSEARMRILDEYADHEPLPEEPKEPEPNPGDIVPPVEADKVKAESVIDEEPKKGKIKCEKLTRPKYGKDGKESGEIETYDGNVIFPDEEHEKDCKKALEALYKELQIHLDLVGNTPLRLACKAFYDVVTGDGCPEIPPQGILLFSNILREFEIGLTPEVKKE